MYSFIKTRRLFQSRRHFFIFFGRSNSKSRKDNSSVDQPQDKDFFAELFFLFRSTLSTKSLKSTPNFLLNLKTPSLTHPLSSKIKIRKPPPLYITLCNNITLNKRLQSNRRVEGSVFIVDTTKKQDVFYESGGVSGFWSVAKSITKIAFVIVSWLR